MEPQGILGGFNRSLGGAGALADPLDRSLSRPSSAGALSPGRCRDRSRGAHKPVSKVTLASAGEL